MWAHTCTVVAALVGGILVIDSIWEGRRYTEHVHHDVPYLQLQRGVTARELIMPHCRQLTTQDSTWMTPCEQMSFIMGVKYSRTRTRHRTRTSQSSMDSGRGIISTPPSKLPLLYNDKAQAIGPFTAAPAVDANVNHEE